jgi:ABC-2 type transport system permease protein
MTASVHTSATTMAAGRSPMRGLGTLVRKDITEWRRGRRAWIVATVVSLVMVLTAANAWITTRLIEALPAQADGPTVPASMAPLDNLMAGVVSQIFILAAIFAVASLLVRERETGTLAWIASKPVTRHTILMSKWISSSLVLAVSAVIVPVVATFAVVTVLYGTPDPATVAIVTAGGVAAVVFFAAFGLAASTILPGQVPVVAAGFVVFLLGPVIAGIAEPVGAWLPMSILSWSVGLAGGAAVGWITPVAWAVGTVGLLWFGMRRLRGVEL